MVLENGAVIGHRRSLTKGQKAVNYLGFLRLRPKFGFDIRTKR